MKKISRKKVLTILFIGMIGFLVLSTGISFAKYVGNEAWNLYLESQDFYFTSAQLSDKDNLNNKWDGGAVYFEVSNFKDNEEASNHDISYTVNCEIEGDTSGNLECKLNGTNSDTYTSELARVEICRNDTTDGVDVSTLDKTTCENRGYTWVSGNTTVNNFFEITSKDPSYKFDNVNVTITAKSTEPYEKTLTGKFTLVKDYTLTGGIILEHESYGDYEKIIVTNATEENKNYLLRWDPAEVKISKTEYYSHSVDTDGNINEIEFFIGTGETKTFIFYKTQDTINVDENDFIIVENTVSDKIKIVGVSQTNRYYSTELSEPTFNENTAFFHVSSTYATSTISYDIVVQNATPYDYILKNIDDIFSNSNQAFRLNNYTYGTTIPANSEITLSVTISSLRTNQTGRIELKLNFADAIETPEITEYLSGAKSTTGSYIKTGFFPSSESKIVVDFTFLSRHGASTWLFSSRRAYKNQMFGVAWNTTESLLQFDTVSYNLGPTGYKVGERYIAEISKEALILNGRTYANPPDTPWQSIFEFYMFANNEARTVRGHTNGQAVIHSAKIYESGVLVLDAKPVILESGETAYYNAVNNVVMETVGTLVPYYETTP